MGTTFVLPPSSPSAGSSSLPDSSSFAGSSHFAGSSSLPDSSSLPGSSSFAGSSAAMGFSPVSGMESLSPAGLVLPAGAGSFPFSERSISSAGTVPSSPTAIAFTGSRENIMHTAISSAIRFLFFIQSSCFHLPLPRCRTISGENVRIFCAGAGFSAYGYSYPTVFWYIYPTMLFSFYKIPWNFSIGLRNISLFVTNS